MVSASFARNTVGVVGNVISFFLFISPVHTFVKIWKKKDVESFDPKPYLCTVLNCLFWCYYGMPFVNPNSILVVTINSVGLVLELIYLAIFAYYAPSKGKKKVGKWLVLEVIGWAAVVLVTMLAIHEHQMAETIGRRMRAVVIGIICDIFNVIMYASPLFIVKQVIKTRSVKYMPFWLSVANFVNGTCWTAYALIGEIDYFILISNGLGAIAGAIQLIVYGIYFRTTPKDDAPELPEKPKPTSAEVQLSNVV